LFACTEREAREATALTYGMITMVDDAVGRILERLKTLGLDDTTIVMFTADHGDYMGDHQLMLKGPMHYQALVRVPFLWREPDGGARGRRKALASTLDIARTVLDRAGVEAFQGLQGLSLLPFVNGAREGRDAVLIEEEGQRVYLNFDRRVRVRTLVTERHRLSVYDGVAWGELYDLDDDPNELKNLWDDPSSARLRGDMTERLVRAMVAHSDTHPYPTGLA
jgi:arylsulfatase A-like enzyme